MNVTDWDKHLAELPCEAQREMDWSCFNHHVARLNQGLNHHVSCFFHVQPPTFCHAAASSLPCSTSSFQATYRLPASRWSPDGCCEAAWQRTGPAPRRSVWFCHEKMVVFYGLTNHEKMVVYYGLNHETWWFGHEKWWKLVGFRVKQIEP